MRRIASIIFLLLSGLCACRPADDPRAPFTDSRIPPGLEHRFYPPQGWTWGLIKVGTAPAARYGVAAPATRARDQILILTAYGEPAEVWFETVNDLVARGHVVWVLEPLGQSGSSHYALPRDLIDAPSLDPDVADLLAFAAAVARERPLFVISSGKSAPVALRAAELGLKADGLILSAPKPSRQWQVKPAQRMTSVGLGRLRAQGGKAWSNEAPDYRASELALDRQRASLSVKWQQANPDLRMGGPSWRWRAAFFREQLAAEQRRADIRIPMLELTRPRGLEFSPWCGRTDRCTIVNLPLGYSQSPQLAPDETRNRWLDAIERFIDPARTALAPAPATVTLDEQS